MARNNSSEFFCSYQGEIFSTPLRTSFADLLIDSFILFIWTQFSTVSTAFCVSLNGYCTRILKSLANMNSLTETRKSGKSFTKMQNRSGRSSGHCGTLHVTFNSGTHKLFPNFPIVYRHLENASTNPYIRNFLYKFEERNVIKGLPDFSRKGRDFRKEVFIKRFMYVILEIIACWLRQISVFFYRTVLITNKLN